MTLGVTIALLAGLGVCGWVMEGVCYSRLRDLDDDEWERLGRPTFFLRHVKSLPSVTFFYAGRFRKLDDSLLSFLSWGMIAANLAMYGTVCWILFLKLTGRH